MRPIQAKNLKTREIEVLTRKTEVVPWTTAKGYSMVNHKGIFSAVNNKGEFAKDPISKETLEVGNLIAGRKVLFGDELYMITQE